VIRRSSIRPIAVWLHRWVGLLMTAFLILEGVSGSVLAFRKPLERWISPQLFVQARPGVPTLGLAELAKAAERAAPEARIGYFSVEREQVIFRMEPRTDPATGKARPLDFDHLFLDPWSGRELGRCREGDPSQGKINLVTFIYKLHMNLAAGESGALILGIVALAWTVDCLLSVYLTLPVALSRFLARWKPAWGVKWPSSTMRIYFDLHRAGGLWAWPLLFVFAWSSVMFNLYDSVYQPVTKALFGYRSGMDEYQALLQRRHAIPPPRLDWRMAQAAGERLMARAATEHGFKVERPYGMAYLGDVGVYTYAVVSSLRVQDSGWSTSLWLDSDTGELIDLDLPSGQRAGNTVDVWLRAIHFADLRNALFFRALVCVLGLVVTALSVTGVYIWLRKRRARRFRPASTLTGAPS